MTHQPDIAPCAAIRRGEVRRLTRAACAARKATDGPRIRPLVAMALLAAIMALCPPATGRALDLDDPLVAAGKVLYEETAGGVGCATCHGTDGSGNPDAGGPYIRGVAASTFKSAVHGGVPAMEFLGLKSTEEKQVFAYLTYLGQPTPVRLDPVAEAGKQIFERTAGGVGCASCHGASGEGDVGPNIRGKDEVAIMKQLKVNDQMAFIDLTKEEVDQVAAYLRYLHDLEAH